MPGRHCPYRNMPPHMRDARKLRKACCCLGILLILIFLNLCYVAHEVHKMSEVLTPESGMVFEIDETTLCNDICTSMCEKTTSLCESTQCISTCSQYMQQRDEMMKEQFDSSSSDSSEDDDNTNNSQLSTSQSSTSQTSNSKHSGHGSHGRGRGGRHGGHGGGHGRGGGGHHGHHDSSSSEKHSSKGSENDMNPEGRMNRFTTKMHRGFDLLRNHRLRHY